MYKVPFFVVVRQISMPTVEAHTQLYIELLLCCASAAISLQGLSAVVFPITRDHGDHVRSPDCLKPPRSDNGQTLPEES